MFESLNREDLPYFLDIMALINEHGVPSAHPIADRQGGCLHTLKGKPAALVQRLHGASIHEPTADHCAAVGAVLARMHIICGEFLGHRDNPRGQRWRQETARNVMPQLSVADAELLQEELRFQSLYRHSDLPRGVIHADLFRDNVLFTDDGELSGVIDFYYACNDALLFDVAVTVNDWCSLNSGELNWEYAKALLGSYHRERRLNSLERGAWPVMLRAAALRFWLSRLYQLHYPRAGELTQCKDPDTYKNVLLHRVDIDRQLDTLWVEGTYTT